MTEPPAPSVAPPEPPLPVPSPPPPRKFGCLFWGCALVVLLLLALGGGAWWIVHSLRPADIEPPQLTQAEQTELDRKLEILREAGDSRLEQVAGPATEPPRGSVDLPEEPDPDFVRKPIIITEREINAIIAHNTDLADKVSVTLRPNRIKFSINIPVPQSFPVMGGRQFRFAGLARAVMQEGTADVRVERLSLGGIPVPSAWIMDIREQNLLERLFPSDEARRALVEGFEKFEIRNGEMEIRLAE